MMSNPTRKISTSSAQAATSRTSQPTKQILSASTRQKQSGAQARRTPSRRPNRFKPPTASLPSMPPSLSIQSNMATQWIRNYVAVDSNINFIDNIGSEVFFAYTAFSQCYGEYRIRRINVWYVPQTAVMTTPGNYAFAVIDSGEVKTAGEFKTIALMPGSTIRKLFQPAHGVWFPTEPSDKEWYPFDNHRSLFCIRIATTGLSKVDGYCVYDAYVSFRATSAALKESLPNSQINVSQTVDPSIDLLTVTSSLEQRVKDLELILSKATIALP